MAQWFEDNAQSIGRTPLVRINRLQDRQRARILAKIEGRNPAYSVKCRIGAAMVWDAEKSGRARPRQGDRRADERQHRHRAGLRRRRARLPAHPDHARDDERRAAQAARGLRRQAGPHRGRQGHERRHRARPRRSRRRTRAATCCCSSSRTPPTPPSTSRPPARRSGTTPTASGHPGLGRRHRRDHHRRVAAISRRRAASPSAPSPSSRPPARCSRQSAPASRSSRPAQDPGHRRGLRAGRARSVAGRRGRAGDQRGGHRASPPAAREEGILVRHLVRRGRRR